MSVRCTFEPTKCTINEKTNRASTEKWVKLMGAKILIRQFCRRKHYVRSRIGYRSSLRRLLEIRILSFSRYFHSKTLSWHSPIHHRCRGSQKYFFYFLTGQLPSLSQSPLHCSTPTSPDIIQLLWSVGSHLNYSLQILLNFSMRMQ